MKKILIATTALVATTGVAAADITMGGYGRFGVAYDSTKVEKKASLESRFRMNVDGKATTDGGVAFSARIRLQANDNATSGQGGAVAVNAARFSAEAGGLRIDAGNAGGAIDNLPGYYGAYETGLQGMTGQYAGADYGFAGYASGAAAVDPTIYGRYAAGAFAVAVSYTQAASDQVTATSEATEAAIHGAYSFNALTVALGYSKSTNNPAQESMTVGTVSYGAGAMNGTLLVGSEKIGGSSDTFYGLAATYDVSSALMIGANYGSGNGDNDGNAYGIGATYSLGGGVSIKGGIGQTQSQTLGVKGDRATVADLGVQFSF